MGNVNRPLIAAVVLIMATGLYKYYVIKDVNGSNPALTRIIIGGYMLALFASLFDLVGLGIGQLVGQILLLAAGAGVLYVVVPDLAKKFGTQGQGTSSSSTTTPPSSPPNAQQGNQGNMAV